MMLKKSVCATMAAAALSITAVAYAVQPLMIHPPQVVKNVSGKSWISVKELPPGAKMLILAGDPDEHEPFVAPIKLPANYTIPFHTHPNAEYDTILSGSLKIELDGKQFKTSEISLKEDDFVKIPAKLVHSIHTNEETVIQISGVGPWGVHYIK